jgi:hypothetical protein
MNLDNIPADNEFQFDDWAALYKTDKRAFEARRHMILALELAKATHISLETKQNLGRLAASLDDKSDQERLELSTRWMINSAEQLLMQLEALALKLGDAVAAGPTIAQPKQ